MLSHNPPIIPPPSGSPTSFANPPDVTPIIFRNIIEVQNVETVKRLVERGVGVTIIPEVAVKRELTAGWLKQIALTGLDLKASYYLLHQAKRPLSLHAKKFLLLIPETLSLSHKNGFKAIASDE